jgi:purine-binding chemotaxis protein CheW
MNLSTAMRQPSRPPKMNSTVDTSVITGIGSIQHRMPILMDIEGLMSSPEMGLINATH